MARSKVSLPNVVKKSRGPLETIGEARWHRIENISSLLRSGIRHPLSQKQAERAAKLLGVHWTSVYRYRQRLGTHIEATAVAGRMRGFPPGKSRLSKEQEYVIAETIGQYSRRKGPLRVSQVFEEIDQRCRLKQLTTPSRSAIDRRLQKMLASRIHRRGKADPSSTSPENAPGSFYVKQPLDVVQIDHTRIDVIVVDDLYREPVGRPWLTVAIDVASRAVVAFVLSFDAPNAATVAMCIARMATPKLQWLRSLQLELDWSIHGIPRSLHLDNAPEFKSRALKRGCVQYGIELVYRPPARPHFGGHIERLMGTLMVRVEGLPGATGNTTKGRKQRAPEKKAALSLTELERWLAIEIVERYHHREHRGLQGGTPFGAWQKHSPPKLPVKDLETFRISFLPAVERKIRLVGVEFNHIRYWHDAFASWDTRNRHVLIHYDPRDLSKLYIKSPAGPYLRITYADLRRPPISWWELRAALVHLRKTSRMAVNESRLFAAIDAQRRLVDAARTMTRKARRAVGKVIVKRAKDRKHEENNEPSDLTTIDYSRPAPPFDVEIW